MSWELSQGNLHSTDQNSSKVTFQGDREKRIWSGETSPGVHAAGPIPAWACRANTVLAGECLFTAEMDNRQNMLFPFLDDPRRPSEGMQQH